MAPHFERSLVQSELQMRTGWIFLCVILSSSRVMAQGNTRDFGRAGPRQEMLKYYAQVQKEVYEHVLLRWRDAAERDDAPALAKLYADKASYFPPRAGGVQTRSAIRDYFQRVLGDVGDVSVSLIEFGTSGDLAYVSATVTFRIHRTDGSDRSDVYTDVMVLRRAGEAWQIETHLSRPEPANGEAHRASGLGQSLWVGPTDSVP